MSGRPRKRRIRHPTKDDDHVVTRVGRVMHYHKCWEIGHNKTKCPYQERPKLTYLRSKGIVIQEAPSSSIPYPTATPSTSNTMPPSPTPSDSNTMPPPLTPSPYTSNTMPPPSGYNTMLSPRTPSGSNISVGSNIIPSHATSASTRTNKGKCLLIPKKEVDLPKVVLLAAKVVLGVV
ncbi:hypothetical protein Tco_0731639 [Tanacetum coccineum]